MGIIVIIIAALAIGGVSGDLLYDNYINNSNNYITNSTNTIDNSTVNIGENNTVVFPNATTIYVTPAPTAIPTITPTPEPTNVPDYTEWVTPTPEPTVEPTITPTIEPSPTPSPTPVPTLTIAYSERSRENITDDTVKLSLNIQFTIFSTTVQVDMNQFRLLYNNTEYSMPIRYNQPQDVNGIYKPLPFEFTVENLGDSSDYSLTYKGTVTYNIEWQHP